MNIIECLILVGDYWPVWKIVLKSRFQTCYSILKETEKSSNFSYLCSHKRVLFKKTTENFLKNWFWRTAVEKLPKRS